MEYKDYLSIGFIQTIVEGEIAWINSDGSYRHNMSRLSEERVIYEIKKGFSDILNDHKTPQIIILPELTIPLGYENDLKKLSASSGTVVIAGLDFLCEKDKARNKAVVIVPANWPLKYKSKSASVFYFGKSYFSYYEEQMFGKENLIPETSIYIIDAAQYGKIGVAICSDFFDIERFVIYKGRIHHLIIIAHNIDTESYYFLAEAIARLVFCNVVICNTGEYGDSIAYSPYHESHERIIYRHKGKKLFSTQVVNLPVKTLDEEQKEGVKSKFFKSKPPGYIKRDF